MSYYKATAPSGRDFHTGSIDYAAALASGAVISHPDPGDGHPSRYLSVATVPTDCTGSSWPLRLFEVEPVGVAWAPDNGSLPNKVACHALRVTRELPAHEALGPQGQAIVALAERLGVVTEAQWREWYRSPAAARAAAWDAARAAARAAAWAAARAAAWDAARDAARAAARDAAWAAARAAAWAAAWAAARDAACGLTVRDRIAPEQYRALTAPLAALIGPIHPEDPA